MAGQSVTPSASAGGISVQTAGESLAQSAASVIVSAQIAGQSFSQSAQLASISAIAGAQSVSQASESATVSVRMDGQSVAQTAQSLVVSADVAGQSVSSGELSGSELSSNDTRGDGGAGFVNLTSSLWWRRKPKNIQPAQAAKKLAKLVKAIESVVEQKIEHHEPIKPQEIRLEVKSILAEMPGFDWRPFFRAVIEQAQQQAAADEARRQIARIRLKAQNEIAIFLMMA